MGIFNLEIKRTLKEKIFAIINEYYDPRLGSKLKFEFEFVSKQGEILKIDTGILKRDSRDKINFQKRILVIKKRERIFKISSNRIPKIS